MALYDTAGMERYTASIPPTYFRDAKAVILVYSIDCDDSMDNIPTWSGNFNICRLGESSLGLMPILVGNKADLEENRAVTHNRAIETGLLCGISSENIFEVSAKSGKGVDELFDKIALLINKTDATRPRRNTIVPGHEEEELKKSKTDKCVFCLTS